VRRLLALPLLACAVSFAPPADAAVQCHGVYSGSTNVGVCAGIICVDLCGPELVVDPTCTGTPAFTTALCAAIDNL
jgi:hypothetical protein